jgi:dienelactone hydrolase
MLGLSPLPERTDLKPVITGTDTLGTVKLEKLHFQSLPQLYVTANFYSPVEKSEKPLPTILYVCGHAVMKQDGVSFGNKAGYHHHGIWFAQHGYTCLIIDTLQLGEIPGEHHGTHHLNKWWWISRGYTSAGVEAWNCIRALDYLQTRPEVDMSRIGVTGRSGGGAYSWWIAALDERIHCAAPTAGITSMHNHIVDGVIEGHCDCMFQLNTYRWDYDRVAALIAPRALLICNTDKDPIFPVDGVFQLYQSTRRLYEKLGAGANIGLHIAEGPHSDMQPLNTGAFHWMERHLKGADKMATTDVAAKKSLQPEQLRVFKELPADQRNQRIDHEFVPQAKTSSLASAGDWPAQRDAWMSALHDKVFRAWPKDAAAPKVMPAGTASAGGITLSAYDITAQGPFTLRMHVAHREGLKPEDLELTALHVLDEQGWADLANTYASSFPQLFGGTKADKPDAEALKAEADMFKSFKWAMAYVAPRGVGLTAWTGSEKAQTHRLRRLALLGETKESGQVYDIRRCVQALQAMPGLGKSKLWISAHRDQAVNALYASLYEKGVSRLDLHEMPTSHMAGPAYLNVLRFLDIPQAAAMATERCKVIIYSDDKAAWSYVTNTATHLGLEKSLQLRDLPKAK